MEIYKIVPLSDNLWAIDEIGKTVMYVVNGTEKALLLDTGFGFVPLREVVRSLCGDKPVVVVNSHGHGDHNSGNNQFDVVHVGRFDEPASHAIVTPEDRVQFQQMFFEQFTAQGGSLPEWNPGPAPCVAVLCDGDRIDLGGYSFEVLECPGHSPGSIALFEETHRWLFTGDLLLTWEVWGQLEGSTALCVYQKSLERLAQYESRVDKVFPAHWVDPCGFPPYQLPPRILSLYAQGTARIVSGEDKGVPYPFGGKPMRCAFFEIGGMVYDPTRIGLA